MPLAPIPTLPAPPATTIAEPPTTTATLPQRTIHPTSYQFQQQSIVLAEPSSPTSLEAYTTLPPADIPNGIVDANTQQKFTKIWDKEKNYTGEPYDLLDDKLRIFMSICYNIQVKPDQFHALFPRILTGRAQTYYIDHINWTSTFRKAYDSIKQHFDTEVNHVHYYTEWTTISFNKLRADNATKSLHEVLQLLLDKLQLCQRALGNAYAGNVPLRTTLINACRGVPELEYALFKPAEGIEPLFADLRSSVETHLARGIAPRYLQGGPQYHQDLEEPSDHMDPNDHYYLDRRYNNNRGRFGQKGYRRYRGNAQRGSYNAPRGSFNSQRFNRPQGRYGHNHPWNKKCFVCNKEGCWSTKHTAEERQRSRDQYVAHCHFIGITPPQDLTAYVLDFEGHEMDAHDDANDPWDEDDNEDNDNNPEQWHTSQMLCQQAFNHLITGEDVYSTSQNNATPASQFMIEERYSRLRFQGIIIDTGAAKVSTAGYDQCIALQREDPAITLDKTTAGQASIKFGNGEAILSLGSIALKTPLGRITFHILKTPTPFLLSLADMDRLGIYFNNLTDTIVGRTTLPVIRKWGHPWFLLPKTNEAAIAFLTESEIRTLHRRFGHPAVPRLHNLLRQAGHNDVTIDILENISRFCHHCQMHSQAPRRFKFTLKDDQEFNYEIVADVLYLGTPQRPVLHVVDTATAFQAARFLLSMSAKDTWEALRALWIDTYLGPPDTIKHDAGTNFASLEFRNEAKLMGITCKQVPVEAHWSVGKVERYHAPLRRAFEILHAEIGTFTSPESILQMAIKAINDTAGPNGIVPTLLVFGAYPRMALDSPPSATTLKRAAAAQKAMKMLRQLSAERQVQGALHTKNGPSSTGVILSLPLQSEVRVWREKLGWQGPFKISAIDGSNVTIDTINGPQTFRSTLVQPYFRDETTIPAPAAAAADDSDIPVSDPASDSVPVSAPAPAPVPAPNPPAPRKRGRPPGSKNKPKTTFLVKKEEDAYQLAIKLRDEGIITTPGTPFEESDSTEIDDLLVRGVFSFERYNEAKHGNHHIFRSRMVREVKGKETKPYEKSRLVVQGHNDQEKTTLLTQSPTIQRVSQRLISAISPDLLSHGMTLSLRDITQAYPQAQTELFRTILTHLPAELEGRYPEGTIIRVIKPLYGIAEAGVHWFRTYHGHHVDNLDMSTSTYDLCFLITNKGPDNFGIVGMQTDDTLMLGTQRFSALEEAELVKAQFRAKPKTTMTPGTSIDFNGAKITLQDTTFHNALLLQQKGQAAKIEPIDIKAYDRAQQYVEQRARGAYVASICQPEASFDISIAAQVQTPTEEDCTTLNKRLQWQKDHQQRGLTYIPIDLANAKLIVFTDGSFANNKDLSSQLGFVIA
ncbi:reverse transcriptase (RNA-dependent DNA polymerase) [Hirsutella rhossiliensis]